MLADALSFPKRGDDWIPTLLIGGVLSALSVLVLPGFVVQGYLLRCMRTAATGGTTPPSFTQWGGLFVDGLKLLVVNVGYALLAVVPSAILGGGASLLVGQRVGAVVAGLLLVVGVLLVAFLLPAAYVNFALEARLGAAFDLRAVWRGATTGRYLTAWLIAVAVAVVGGLLGSALAVLLVGFVVLFYVQVATAYLWGVGVASGTAPGR